MHETPAAAPLTLDAAHLAPDVTPEMVAQQTARIASAHDTLVQGTGAGSDFRGWLDPLNGGPPVPISARPGSGPNRLVVDLPLTDSPRLLVIDEAAAAPAPVPKARRGPRPRR